ncbi:hypothetical protein BH11PLA2_BH11PLA2_25210 [soil metagenome]
MTATAFNVGAFVHGPPTSARVLVQHGELLAAYAEGGIDDDREAYLSHFAFGPEMQSHFATNRNSVKDYAGPCCCRWLVFDIDRADNLAAALDDARKLVKFLHDRYPENVDLVPVYFSGGKGFHVLVELSHAPPPAVGFQHVAKTFALAISAAAGVKTDTSIYDVNHIVRLPNTQHPKTGLYRRLIDVEGLFMRDLDGHLADAKHPNPASIPSADRPVPQLLIDWRDAEQQTRRTTEARTVARRDFATADTMAPRYFLELLRFGVDEGERHRRVFQCAAWLTEQGAPPSLCSALLTEPARDVGLTPKDVTRQIQCGIEHARRQRGTTTKPEPTEEELERLAIQQEADPLLPGALDFPFGALAPNESEGEPV